MAQWVKNLTTVAWVTAEVRVQFLSWHNGLKDLTLLQLWHRLQLQIGFNPWSWNFHMQWVWPLKTKVGGWWAEDFGVIWGLFFFFVF